MLEGLSNGSIWALIAIGYTLVYGIIELINFAHGDVFMIGSFTASRSVGALGLTTATLGPLGLVFGLLLTLIVTMLVTGSLNVLIERVGYKPLRSAPKLAPLITAVGFSFVLQNVGSALAGRQPGVAFPTSSATATRAGHTFPVLCGASAATCSRSG